MTIIQKERKPQFTNSFGCKETHKTVGIYMCERENCTCHSINISLTYLPGLKLSMCAQPIQHEQVSFLKASSEGVWLAAQIHLLTYSAVQSKHS